MPPHLACGCINCRTRVTNEFFRIVWSGFHPEAIERLRADAGAMDLVEKKEHRYDVYDQEDDEAYD